MSWETVQQRAWYQYKRLWIGLASAICLCVLALPHLQQTYRQWRGKRHVQRGADAVARGDIKLAIMEGRVALAYNAKDPEALRIIAKSLEAAGSPGALEIRRQLDALRPGDIENTLGIVDDCLRAGDSSAAEEELKSVSSAGQNGALYHSLAAGVALSRNDVGAAESHLVQAVALDPQKDDYRLKLAGLQLDSKHPELRATALRTLDEMCAKPSQRLLALRLLLGDATAKGDSERAYKLAETLASDPQASIGDKLVCLSTLRDVKTTEFQSFSALNRAKEFYAELEKLQLATEGKPAEVTEVMTWMNSRGLALSVTQWAEKLDADAASKPPVCVPVAEAYAKSSEWKLLKARLEKISWQKIDFLRLAYLSEAQARLDDQGAAGVTWNKAVEAAHDNPIFLEALATEALGWDAQSWAEEVLWKRAAIDRCPRWAIDKLWELNLKRGDTPRLQKVSKLILQSEPKSVMARNNYIGLSLLSGQELNAVIPLAEALQKENPTDPRVTGTYALSLYKEGKADRAVSVLAMLKTEQLKDPQTALYYGIFTAASGKMDEAGPYLAIGKKAPQLPEERAMGDFYRLVCEARSSRERGDHSGAIAAWSVAISAAGAHGADWLEWLGGMAVQWRWQENAEEVAMRLSRLDRCPSWAIGPLWTAAVKSGDSAQIYAAAKLIYEANPKNLPARSRYILVSLLSRRHPDSIPRMAETLHEENADDPEAALIYGLLLTLQGKSDEAVGLMKGLRAEVLQQARPSLYYGIFLAAAGMDEKAAPLLRGELAGANLPDEEILASMLVSAGDAYSAGQSGDAAGASEAWKKAMTLALSRPDWLELLGRKAVAWKWNERAEEALWKLAETESCPRWALDFLLKHAEQRADSIRLYKLSRLMLAIAPSDVAIRNRYVALALLTGDRSVFPDRLAKTLYDENPGNASVTATYALSLCLEARSKEAVVVMTALRSDQLREPRVALFYGIALNAAGQAEKAAEYLQIGGPAARLPEEKALLHRSATQPRLGAAR